MKQPENLVDILNTTWISLYIGWDWVWCEDLCGSRTAEVDNVIRDHTKAECKARIPYITKNKMSLISTTLSIPSQVGLSYSGTSMCARRRTRLPPISDHLNIKTCPVIVLKPVVSNQDHFWGWRFLVNIQTSLTSRLLNNSYIAYKTICINLTSLSSSKLRTSCIKYFPNSCCWYCALPQNICC